MKQPLPETVERPGVGGIHKIRRFIPLLVGICLLIVIVVSSQLLIRYGPDIRINTTPSMPRGLYRITHINPSYPIHKGDIILYSVPRHVESIVYGRHYLKKGVPLMKPIAALVGDSVCIRDHLLAIIGVKVGKVFAADGQGEVIPYREGCHTLKDNEILPVSTYYERSFDGRYHGVIDREKVIGIATPLWVWPENP